MPVLCVCVVQEPDVAVTGGGMESGRGPDSGTRCPPGNGGDITRGQLVDHPGSNTGRCHRGENHPSG